MLDQETKRRIDTARDILVGKLPNPQSQVEQITIAMIYKFMDDMDKEAMDLVEKLLFLQAITKSTVGQKYLTPNWAGMKCWHFTEKR
jgi:type I restriction enzyme M protein